LNTAETFLACLVPTFPVTAETLDRYPGWLGAIPEAFTKPWHSLQPTWSGELKVLDR